MKFSEVILAGNSIDYIRRCLGESRCTFAQHLLERCTLEAGVVTTFLPISMQDQVRNFSVEELGYGGINDIDTIDYVVEAIAEALKTPQSIFIAQNENANIEDPVVARFNSRLFNFDSEVYHVVYSDESTPEKIEAAIREGHSYLEIGVVSLFNDTPKLKNKSSIRQQALIQFASNARLIFCSVFDGEGFLVWKRSDL